MIKLMLLLRRKAGMSVEEFREHYEHRHVPLASSFDTPLVRYRRNYVVEQTVGSSGYDCITEVWYDLDGKWSDHRDRLISPEMAQTIARDEARFLDRAATCIMVVEETESAPETLRGHQQPGSPRDA